MHLDWLRVMLKQFRVQTLVCCFQSRMVPDLVNLTSVDANKT
jgi:hypothetical protein